MRYELRRRLVTVARCLAELGETENARAIARRVHDGTAVEWLRGEHGEHVWAEVEGVARFAARFRLALPSMLCGAAVALERAFGEAEALAPGSRFRSGQSLHRAMGNHPAWVGLARGGSQ